MVTGASSGIGAATAGLFGQCGARVGVHYNRSRKGALEVLRGIREGGGVAEVFKADFLERPARRVLIDSFIAKFRGIDVLVNNAGAICVYKPFLLLNDRDWDEMIELHLKAPFLLACEAFRSMVDGGGGRIINISTNAVIYGGLSSMHYYASKAALESCTRGFAKEGAKHNILVNAIRCGLIDTPMRRKIPGYGEVRFRERAKLVPLRRPGSPLEVARMILFLASSGGDFITGQIITVSGGE